jgi:ATP-dependent Lon protease
MTIILDDIDIDKKDKKKPKDKKKNPTKNIKQKKTNEKSKSKDIVAKKKVVKNPVEKTPTPKKTVKPKVTTKELQNEIIDKTEDTRMTPAEIDSALGNMQIVFLSNMPPLQNEREYRDDDNYDDEFEEEYNEDSIIRTEKKRKAKDIEKDNVNYKYYAPFEKTYYDKLHVKKQKKFGEIEKITNELNDIDTPIRFKILDLQIDNKYKAIALKKIEGMEKARDGESAKKKNWIDSFCKIPFGKFKQLPVDSTSSKEEVGNFLQKTKNVLDENIYGNNDAKDHFLRILAQWTSNPKASGNVIGLSGAAGIGKTMFVKEGISKALDIPFAFIPLGGTNDGAYLIGNTYCYEGSNPGHLINVLINSKCMNPIIFFDELDKVSETRGKEIINTLIHLTDPVQNGRFCSDKYFSELEFDFSRCLIVFTYNDEHLINPILRDRITKINFDKYSTDDKIAIVKDYVLPKMLKEFNFNKNEILFKENNIRYLINKTEKEEGVRNLKRNIELLLSTINLLKITDNEKIFNKKNIKIDNPVNINEDLINKLIKLKISNPSIEHLYI